MNILHTAPATHPGRSRGERLHLAKASTGEYLLVRSWMVWSALENEKRHYSIENRIGSHITVDEALERFDKWYTSEN